MNLFTISQLEQFSGIKAHTIRIWEKRYNALTPNRSEGNTRYYDSSQLRRLLNIVSLMGHNFKVSELCAFPDHQLFSILDKQLKAYTPVDGSDDYYISQLIAAGVSYDEPYFEKILANCLLRLGVRNTYVRIIYPMLSRIGLMWNTDTLTPAHEHFISNIIRQKLYAIIDALPPGNQEEDAWLLFLPENEFHEIGLLFAHYLIKQAGKRVYYLGSNVPLATLSEAIKEITPAHLLFFFVHNERTEDSQEYLNVLKRSFSKIRIHLAGNEKHLKALKTGSGVQRILSVEDLQKQLQ